MEHLPYEIKDQIIQCFGRSFHFKDTVESFLRSAGVSRELANKYRDEPKFVWARKLLNELEDTEEGRIVQRKILTELCKLRNVIDDVLDRNSGLDALRKLKILANKHQIEYEEKKKESVNRSESFMRKTQIIEERNNKLTELRNQFFKGVTSTDRQKSGYSLEDLLKDLFSLFEIEFKKSYKTSTQQIDGHFKLDGFNYLIEAKWRKDLPNEAEIGSFQRKVSTKLDATRGLFISVSGFRDKVISELNGHSNIILMTGEDLMHVLEGRINLKDALQMKIEKASQYGFVYTKIL